MKACFWIVGLLFLTGCTGKTGTSASALRYLRLSLSQNPSTLDPALSQDSPTNEVMRQVFEGLVRWDTDNTLAPSLAESWAVSADGLTYRFRIKQGVKFHNGQELTARDVKWTWERNSDPTFNSPLARNYLGDIVGVADRIAGKSESISGVTVISDTELEIRLVAPRSYFLGKLTYPATFILPYNSTPKGKIIAKTDEMIGTGPFRANSFTQQSELKLTRNDAYHLGPPKVEGLNYRILKDASTRANLFRAGELDVLSLSQQDVDLFKGDSKLASLLRFETRPSINYIGMNGTVYKPFEDVRVRRAFVMAVDRDKIVSMLLKGVGKKADRILPSSVPLKSPGVSLPPFDPKGARQLLREAGYENLPAIELWTSDSNQDRRAIAEFLVTQLSTNLGVDAKVRLAENSIIIQKATKRELGFFYGNWFADYLDPENFLSVLLSDYGQNRTNYDNKEFSALCRQADSELDPKKRADLYSRAESLVLTDLPWIPLYFVQEVVAVQPRVQGLKGNGFGFLPHSTVVLNP